MRDEDRCGRRCVVHVYAIIVRERHFSARRLSLRAHVCRRYVDDEESRVSGAAASRV